MSPLLEINIQGARGILFNVTGGSDLGLFEVNEAAEVIKEAADPEANIIFGTVIDDRMRDEVKVTVIATGFDGTRKPKPGPRAAASETAVGLESSLDEKSRELLAEIERERAERSPFAVTPASEPLAVEPEPAEVSRSRDREPVPSRPTSLERPAYGDTDLDIPSFLRQPNRERE
jgi:cell division protein FtsZ